MRARVVYTNLDEFLLLAEQNLFEAEKDYELNLTEYFQAHHYANAATLHRELSKISQALETGNLKSNFKLDLSWPNTINAAAQEYSLKDELLPFFVALGTALKKNDFSHAIEINLQRLRLDTSISALADLIKSGKCPLNLDLNLKNTNLTSRNITPLLGALRDLNCPPSLKIQLDNNLLSTALEQAIKAMRMRNAEKHSARAALTFQQAWRHKESHNHISKLPPELASYIHSLAYTGPSIAPAAPALAPVEEKAAEGSLMPKKLKAPQHFAKKIMRFFNAHPAHATRENIDNLFKSAIASINKAAQTRSNHLDSDQDAIALGVEDLRRVETLFGIAIEQAEKEKLVMEMDEAIDPDIMAQINREQAEANPSHSKKNLSATQEEGLLADFDLPQKEEKEEKDSAISPEILKELDPQTLAELAQAQTTKALQQSAARRKAKPHPGSGLEEKESKGEGTKDSTADDKKRATIKKLQALQKTTIEHLASNLILAKSVNHHLKHQSLKQLSPEDNHLILRNEEQLQTAFRNLRLKTMSDMNAGRMSFNDAAAIAVQAERLAAKLEQRAVTFEDVATFKRETSLLPQSSSWRAILSAVIGAVLGFILGAMIGILTFNPLAALAAVAAGSKGAAAGASVCATLGAGAGYGLGFWSTPKILGSNPELEKIIDHSNQIAAVQPVLRS